MSGLWRPLALAAAISLSVVSGVAMAQTVIVTKAPAGSAVELALNADTIATGKADANGEATLPFDLAAHGGKKETSARIYVDLCENLRRVVLVERGLQPPPPEGACVRRELVELFVLRTVTTIVVEVADPRPAVWLRQGRVPEEWLKAGEERAAIRMTLPAPTHAGLMLSGGAGLASVADAGSLACGGVTDCAAKNTRPTYTGSAGFWFNRYLGAEAGYLKPANVTADGSGDTYRFSSFLNTRIVTLVGKVGIPVGRVRIYGQGGANYHQATASTTQTIDDTTVTIDGVVQTIVGGTETFELRTAGWGWVFGAGMETWINPAFSIYAEFERAALKGAATDGSEGVMDDHVNFLLVGGRVRIGR